MKSIKALSNIATFKINLGAGVGVGEAGLKFSPQKVFISCT